MNNAGVRSDSRFGLVRGAFAPGSCVVAVVGAAAVVLLVASALPANAQSADAPLTASFVADTVPSGHGGAGEVFTVRIRFSEDVGVSYKVLRDDALVVDGGVARRFKRVDGSNSLWEIHAEPASDADVTLTLPLTEDCTADDAVCTDSDKPLSHSVTITIPGPEPAPEPPPAPQPPPPPAPEPPPDDSETDPPADTPDDSETDPPADTEVGGEAGEGGSVWSATVTVGVDDALSGFNGFIALGGLSPQRFTVGGTEYRVRLLGHVAGAPRFAFDVDLGVDFVLRAGGVEFASGDASTAQGGHWYLYLWPSGSLGWSAGDEVR